MLPLQAVYRLLLLELVVTLLYLLLRLLQLQLQQLGVITFCLFDVDSWELPGNSNGAYAIVASGCCTC